MPRVCSALVLAILCFGAWPTVEAAPQSAAPFGSVDTPVTGATVTGEVGITGWALDDSGVAGVDIYRSAVAGEPVQANGLVFLGNATLVAGARPDIASLYAAYPGANTAGWGYMLLSNMLPNQGNGSFTISVYVRTVDGANTRLGSKTITLANATATNPFGTIDTPAQGQTVAGVIANFGWALTPNPGAIPADGSTIDVYVNGVVVGHPVFGNFRADIASLFPGYANTEGAVGYFMLDTTLLTNGVHTIAWVVKDNTGKASGVGSRYFTVSNPARCCAMAEPALVSTDKTTDVLVTYRVARTLSLSSIALAAIAGVTTDSTPLHDDGLDGDEAAGDRVYSARIALVNPTPGIKTLRVVAESLGRIVVDAPVSLQSVGPDPSVQASPQTLNAAISTLGTQAATAANALTRVSASANNGSEALANALIAMTDAFRVATAQAAASRSLTSAALFLPGIPAADDLLSAAAAAKKGVKRREIFVDDGTDPRVADLAEWAADQCGISGDDLFSASARPLREQCAIRFEAQVTRPGSSLYELKQSLENIYVKNTLSPAVSLFGDGIADLANWGWVTSVVAGDAIETVVAWVGRRLIIGTGPGVSRVEVPSGAADVLVGFAGDRSPLVVESAPVSPQRDTTVTPVSGAGFTILRDEGAFRGATQVTTAAGFASLSPGSYGASLVRGDVTVQIVGGGGATISAPAPALGLNSNYLLQSVTASGGAVRVSLPTNTRAAGIALQTDQMVLVSFTDGLGAGFAVPFFSPTSVSFVGVVTKSPIVSIEVTALPNSPPVAIRLRDVPYGGRAATSAELVTFEFTGRIYQFNVFGGMADPFGGAINAGYIGQSEVKGRVTFVSSALDLEPARLDYGKYRFSYPPHSFEVVLVDRFRFRSVDYQLEVIDNIPSSLGGDSVTVTARTAEDPFGTAITNFTFYVGFRGDQLSSDLPPSFAPPIRPAESVSYSGMELGFRESLAERPRQYGFRILINDFRLVPR